MSNPIDLSLFYRFRDYVRVVIIRDDQVEDLIKEKTRREFFDEIKELFQGLTIIVIYEVGSDKKYFPLFAAEDNISPPDTILHILHTTRSVWLLSERTNYDNTPTINNFGSLTIRLGYELKELINEEKNIELIKGL